MSRAGLPMLRSLLRAGALAATAIVLAATTVGECVGGTGAHADSARFDAATSCGPAGVVAVRTEPREDKDACGVQVVVHADGGPAAGLPAVGTIAYDDGSEIDYPGDSLLRATVTLEGPVALPDAVPATTVTRTCRTSREWRNVLAISCEGPDPEAACSGTLSIRVDR